MSYNVIVKNNYFMDRYLINRTFEDFFKKKILVIGDVMIDSYVWGNVDRISPEAPVPIVSVVKKENRLGGAANVAKNLLSLGAVPIICSVIGVDFYGNIFRDLLNQNSLTDEGIITSNQRKTTVKTRIISSSQQLIRIDEEDAVVLEIKEEELLLKKIKKLIESGVDAIIFEDYDKGVLTKTLIKEVISLANSKGIITTVDPKKNNFFEYKNATLFKPNLKEIKEGLNVNISIEDKESFVNAIYGLLTKQNFNYVVVTLSENGISGITKDKEIIFYPAEKRNISDVSGAGDTVISVLTLCLISGCNFKDAVFLANLAGGLVCEKVGVVPIDRNEFYNEILKKIF